MALDWNNLTDAQFLNIYGYPRNPPPPPPAFGQWKQPFNSQQLASYEQARHLVAKINSALLKLDAGDPRPMGDGVLAGDDETPPQNDTPLGIYVPTWSNVPGAGPEGFAVGPDGTKYFTLCLRFNNGRSGFNVGLILDKFSRHPLAPAYVVMAIAAEVEGR